ncbi:DegT/DnrJ/EryC1/StrS family aminotransferase [Pseudonocardia saturnea]
MIPVSAVSFGSDVEESVLAVLRSGHIAQGPKVAEFERAFAELVGVRHAVAVNSGSTALTVALRGLDIGRGDEVVTSPFTFIATVNAVLASGATVRFADIRDDDFAVDPAAIDASVTSATRAIMPVHLFGQTADMAPLMEIADRLRVAVVEDAAQAHGARYHGRGAGSFGTGCFSFYATKNLTTGEGGMITTDDEALSDKLRVLRNQGMRARYEYEVVGHNYRMTDLAAAVGLPQMARYGEQVARRQAHAALLTESLAGVPGLRLPAVLPGRDHVWHQYTVLLEPSARVDRDELAGRLGEAGVGSGVYYPRLAFDYDCYKAHDGVVASETPVAASVARRCLSLPVHAGLSLDEVRQVADAVRGILA